MSNVIESKKRDLYEYLNAHDFNPEALGKNGKPDRNTVPENCEAIKFYFRDSQDKKYGPIIATVYQEDDKFHLHLYNSDAPWKSKEFPLFLAQLKKWAVPKKLLFNPDNSKHFHNHYTKRKYMEKQAKELSESYQAINRKTSLNDAVQTVKIIIEHSRPLAETEKRYQHVSRIFIENQTGERFLIPTKRPSVARVFARHIAEGNTPYDERGKHIGTLAEELKRMAGFVRATKDRQFNESAQMLVQEGVSYYQNLKETLRRMSSKRGYNNYFESWTPILVEETTEETTLNELFVKETLDPRIESVLPILSKLHKQKTEVKEVSDLEKWADGMINEKLDAPVIEEQKQDQGFARTIQNIAEADRSDWSWMGDTRVKGRPGQYKLIDINTNRDIAGPFNTQGEAIKYKKDLPLPDVSHVSVVPIREGLSPEQKRVGQLGPRQKARKISPVLGKPEKEHPFQGKLVGASESVARKPHKK